MAFYYMRRRDNWFFCLFFLFFFINLFIYLFIYFWLCWVFVSERGPSPVVASGGHSSSRCAGLSPSRPLLLRSTGSRRAGSVIVAHGPSCSAACGILPDQGPNPCPLQWQADSQPPRHQGSPNCFWKKIFLLTVPKKRQSKTCKTTWRSTRVGQEAEGVRGRHGNNFYFGFLGEEWASWVSSWAGLGWNSLNNFGRLWAMGVISSCPVPGFGVTEGRQNVSQTAGVW